MPRTKNTPTKKSKDTTQRVAKELADLRMYTLKELAPVLGVSNIALKKYIKEGKLKAAVVGGRWRVTVRDLREFIDRGGAINDSEGIHKKA